MKPFHLLAMAALLVILPASAQAQQRPVGGGLRITYPSTNHFSWERGQGFHGGFGNVWVVEREVPVIVERVVVKEVSAPPPLASASGPPPRSGEDRKPYVLGASYASLPASCMKLIEEGVSYYYCSGDWYRQVGQGKSATYRAVARKL